MSTAALARPLAGLRREVRVGGVFVGLGVLAALGFGLGADAGERTTFALTLDGAAIGLPEIGVPSRVGAVVLALICVGIGVARLARRFSRLQTLTLTIGFFVSLLLSFLCWAAAGATLNFASLAQGTLFLSLPLILGSLSGVLCERSGVINIAIEGQLLLGAFMGAFIGSASGNLWVGLASGAIGGAAIGALLAVFSIRYLVDQIVLGVVLNVLVLGITGFLYDSLLQPNADTLNSPGIFTSIKIPLFGDIPVLGSVLFDVNAVVYLAFVLLVVVHVALFHTRWGLRTRAVGEHPTAADTLGIRVLAIRYRNVILGGAIAGIGGAYLTIGTVGAFTKNISTGKGFIALAALIFGRWSPLGALAAALLFGFADQLQSVLSIIGTPIPSEFMLMTPYLATIFAVAGLVGKVRPPKADGKPYIKQ